MKMTRQTVCISTLKKKLDPSLSKGLLFLHAISGCDTTSRLHGIGKATVLKKFSTLKDSCTEFMCASSSKAAISKAGEKVLLDMYGCATMSSLTLARVQKFQTKVSNSTGFVPPEKLPPTSDAAKFYCYHTFHQVQAWRGTDLLSEKWGWQKANFGLDPLRMSKEAAYQGF